MIMFHCRVSFYFPPLWMHLIFKSFKITSWQFERRREGAVDEGPHIDSRKYQGPNELDDTRWIRQLVHPHWSSPFQWPRRAAKNFFDLLMPRLAKGSKPWRAFRAAPNPDANATELKEHRRNLETSTLTLFLTVSHSISQYLPILVWPHPRVLFGRKNAAPRDWTGTSSSRILPKSSRLPL